MLAYALQIYFDFSGYSDMAIGLGRTFGFKLPENFRDPYCAATATEFWRRWHISLSSWFRDYVYIPLGGSREGDAKTVRNLAIVWALTGLWHGANWSFVLWGLGWGLLIILERFVVRPDDRSQGFRVVWRAVILLATLLLWVLFRAETMSYALEVIGRMFSPEAWRAAATNTKWILLWLHDLGPYLVAGIVLAAGVPGAIARRLPSEGRLRDVLDVAGMLALALLTVLSISFVAQGSYNPFLYFQF